MHDYLFGAEVVRLAFVAGIVVSLAFYQRTHLTTGSIVVPGYVGLFFFLPLTVLATFANALTTYWVVNKVIRKRVLLFGRDKFAVQALISIAIQASLLKLSPSTPWLWESDIPILVGVGYVIPALVAHDMARQGIRKTSKAVLVSGAIVAVIILLALALLPGVQAARPLDGFDVMSFHPQWIPLAVLLSAASAWGIQRNYDLRSGGFIGAAYLALLSANLWQVLFMFGVALLSWMIVTGTMLRTMLLFGRRKFAAMMIVSGMVSWTCLWMGSALFGIELNAYQTLGSVALTPVFIPGLLANDMERTNPQRVLVGSILATAFVLPATLFAQNLVSAGYVSTSLFIVAAIAGSIITARQWIPFARRALRVLLDLLRRLAGLAGRHRPHAAIPLRSVFNDGRHRRTGPTPNVTSGRSIIPT